MILYFSSQRKKNRFFLFLTEYKTQKTKNWNDKITKVGDTFTQSMCGMNVKKRAVWNKQPIYRTVRCVLNWTAMAFSGFWVWILASYTECKTLANATVLQTLTHRQYMCILTKQVFQVRVYTHIRSSSVCLWLIHGVWGNIWVRC